MTRKITVNLSENLINAIDSVGANDSPFNLIPNGQRPTRSRKLETLLRYAIDNPPDRDTDQPAPVPVQPVKPVPDAAPVNADNISTHALTPHHIYTIETADILAHILGIAAFRDPLDLKLLAGVTPQHLARRFNLSLHDANRFALLFEFAKRLAGAYTEKIKVTAPSDIASFLMPKLRYLQHEVLISLALDTKGHITDNLMIAEDKDTIENAMIDLISHRILYEGTLNACVFHPREIFRHAIDCNANSIVLAHNHPSGDPQPSREDIMATKQLIEAGNTIGIKVLDHIIIGDGIFVSLKEDGHI